jgi:peptidoglycan/xylan/chitin deacetylase (PgdA/CDA1 family)
MLRSAVYSGLVALGVPALVRRWRAAGVILCYHNVLPPRNVARVGDAGVHLAFERFAEQVRWLARRYVIVPLRELVARLTAGRPLRGVAALTFDDGYDGVFAHAWPLLRELHLPATVFVVADRPERREPFWWDHPDLARHASPAGRVRWLTELKGDGQGIAAALSLPAPARVPASHRPAGWDAIAAAAAEGLEIGAHSTTHRALARLDDTELEREILASRDTIHAHTGLAPTLFAYPYGIWDARVRDAVRAAGYHGAVTLDYGLVGAGADPWALRRVNVPASIPSAAFQVWAAGLYPRRGEARDG